eukprot:NODE_3415_length_789_cov_331.927793.p1 GENE.NODE_3415_length_789_cov_331.927793~~NODE_3415_length_789_cov_331.927793.p1  ORF type:complete len:209 (-),score=45.73 NODE_3415_length_789_cov_331.927793:161-718(-)
MTPRQRSVMDKLEIPPLSLCPEFGLFRADESAEAHHNRVLATYREFAFNMYTGAHLTLLTPAGDYCDAHCQLIEDLQVLKLDQNNGRIIEFPLAAVSKLSGARLHSSRMATNVDGTTQQPADAGHAVFLAFSRRRLVFTFREFRDAKSFKMWMELLVARAQELESGKEKSSRQDVQFGGSGPFTV